MGRTFSSLLAALVIAATALPAAAADVVAEAQAFMREYQKVIQRGDRAALAALYDRNGAYIVGHGRKRFLTHPQIVELYAGPQWSHPATFAWNDLSFEPAGPDVVVVTGLFIWVNSPGDTPGPVSYTGLPVRRDGVLRIRLEDESAAPPRPPQPRPAPAPPKSQTVCRRSGHRFGEENGLNSKCPEQNPIQSDRILL